MSSPASELADATSAAAAEFCICLCENWSVSALDFEGHPAVTAGFIG
jgi:hypothetical protein